MGHPESNLYVVFPEATLLVLIFRAGDGRDFSHLRQQSPVPEHDGDASAQGRGGDDQAHSPGTDRRGAADGGEGRVRWGRRQGEFARRFACRCRDRRLPRRRHESRPRRRGTCPVLSLFCPIRTLITRPHRCLFLDESDESPLETRPVENILRKTVAFRKINP